MMPQAKLQQLSLKELRAYVLANRSDDEALRYYVDRMRDDPNVAHYSGGVEDLPRLEQLIRDRGDKERHNAG